MSEQSCYNKQAQEECATNSPSDISEINPVILELVRFLAKQAAQSDYQELLDSLHPFATDEGEE